LNKIIGSEIKTSNGKGVIEKIYFSELNYLMVKIKFEEKWINYRIESLPEVKEKLVDILNYKN
jgi:hypothetical protein